MGTPEKTRESSADRITKQIGRYLCISSVVGSFFHYLKGSYNAPQGHRMIGGVQAVRMNVPHIALEWAVWGGLFKSFDYTMVYLRQKEDSWNFIMSGAAASGVQSMGKGVKKATGSAVFTASVIALLERVFTVMVDKK